MGALNGSMPLRQAADGDFIHTEFVQRETATDNVDDRIHRPDFIAASASPMRWNTNEADSFTEAGSSLSSIRLRIVLR